MAIFPIKYWLSVCEQSQGFVAPDFWVCIYYKWFFCTSQIDKVVVYWKKGVKTGFFRGKFYKKRGLSVFRVQNRTFGGSKKFNIFWGNFYLLHKTAICQIGYYAPKKQQKLSTCPLFIVFLKRENFIFFAMVPKENQ